MALSLHRAAPAAAFVVGIAACEARAFSADSTQVALSVAIAAITAILSLIGLNATVKLMTAIGQEKRQQTTILLVMSLAKLPVVGAGLYFGIQFAAGDLWLFAGTLVWVYLCAVWFLVANRN